MGADNFLQRRWEYEAIKEYKQLKEENKKLKRLLMHSVDDDLKRIKDLERIYGISLDIESDA